MMYRINYFFAVILLVSSINLFGQNTNITVEGELKKWHKVTLNLQGPNLNESDENNPFLNYRLNVTFKNNKKTYIVPGFYAADGNAAETSAKSGKVWQVRFSPDAIGKWTYEVSFRKGNNIAVDENPDAGKAIAFNGLTGSFFIS